MFEGNKGSSKQLKSNLSEKCHGPSHTLRAIVHLVVRRNEGDL